MSHPSHFEHPQAARTLRGLVLGAAIGVGLAAAAVAVAMLTYHIQADGDPGGPTWVRQRPLASEQLARMKLSLVESPKDETLRRSIRDLDLALRSEHFRTERLVRIGAWLLVVLSGACVLLLRMAAWAGGRLPAPEAGPSRRAWPAATAGAVSTILTTAGIAYLAAVAAANSTPPSPPPPDWPDADAIAQNWPRFRGPAGDGRHDSANVPLSWNVSTGENLLWKTPLPPAGNSSPVVWGDDIFLTAADEKTRTLLCIDANTGTLRWRKDTGDIPGRGKPPEGVMEDTGYAAPTPATDGKRVCAVFANGDVICHDVADGQQLWARNLGTPEINYGYAASPVMFQNLLIIQFDQGMVGDEKSLLLAFDIRSGREVYRRTRTGVGESWTSPIIAQTPSGPQLITCSNPWVIAYDPADGRELWRVDCLEGDGAPSPIYAGNRVFAVNVGSELVAIRTDGTGDVTQTHVAWKYSEHLPDICSPAGNGSLVWILTTEGMLTCLDAANGSKLWKKDFEAKCVSSPALIDGRLVVITEKGRVHVLAAARELKGLSTSDLGQKCFTSPAVMPGRVYLRSETHLLCIGRAKQ